VETGALNSSLLEKRLEGAEGLCHVIEKRTQLRRNLERRSRLGDDFAPRLQGRCPEGSVRFCWGEMALHVEGIVGGCVG
jgi:hypothetical protein